MTILSIVNISIVTFRFSELQKSEKWTSRTPIFGNQEVKRLNLKNSVFRNTGKLFLWELRRYPKWKVTDCRISRRYMSGINSRLRIPFFTVGENHTTRNQHKIFCEFILHLLTIGTSASIIRLLYNMLYIGGRAWKKRGCFAYPKYAN